MAVPGADPAIPGRVISLVRQSALPALSPCLVLAASRCLALPQSPSLCLPLPRPQRARSRRRLQTPTIPLLPPPPPPPPSPIHLIPRTPSCLRDTLHARHSFARCRFHAVTLKSPLCACVYAQFGCLSPRLAHNTDLQPARPIAPPLTRLPLLSRHSLACACHRPPLTGSLASSALIPDFSTLLCSLPAGNIENIRNIEKQQHMFRQYTRLTSITTNTTTPAPLALAL